MIASTYFTLFSLGGFCTQRFILNNQRWFKCYSLEGQKGAISPGLLI